jgi:hypothetical protein
LLPATNSNFNLFGFVRSFISSLPGVLPCVRRCCVFSPANAAIEWKKLIGRKVNLFQLYNTVPHPIITCFRFDTSVVATASAC